jgi:putative PIN family toxin of toxin-antitoxin system
MRVVLDTNVIIAAFASRGLCADIFEVCLENHDLIVSNFILSEVVKNLNNKLQLPKSISHEINDYLRDISSIVEPEKVDKSICRDKNDVMIIGTALSGEAQCIITGDNDLLILRKYSGISIVTPREFWQRLKG